MQNFKTDLAINCDLHTAKEDISTGEAENKLRVISEQEYLGSEILLETITEILQPLDIERGEKMIYQNHTIQPINEVQNWQPIENLQQLIDEKTNELNQLNIKLESEIDRHQFLEQKIGTSEAKMRIVLEAMNDLVMVINTSSDQLESVEIIPTDLSSLSQAEGDIIDRTVERFFHDELANNWLKKVWQALEKQEIIKFDYSLSIQREEVWFSARITPISDNSVLWVARDISDRKQAEAALAESEARLQKLAANIPGAIYTFVQHADGSKQFEYISAACREIQEVTPEQVLNNGNLLEDQIHPNDRDKVQRMKTKSAQRLTPFVCEWRILTQSGKLKWIAANSRPERRDNGDTVWYGTMFDISDRKQAEAALKESEAQVQKKAQQLEITVEQLKRTQSQLVLNEKMASLGQLVAGVAHEINNPTGFIYCNIEPAINYAQSLLELVKLYQQNYSNPAPEIAKQIKAIDLDFIAADFPQLLSSIKEGADRISQIVLSLRNFSRLDEAECKQADIHEGVDNTLLLLQHRLKKMDGFPEIQIIKDYNQLPKIQFYPGQLNQVLMNILGNAIDALEWGNDLSSSQNPQISIRTYRTDTGIAISIADNGPGMTETVVKQVFDPFFTTKPPGKGTGLGLSISYSIVVEKHKGQIKCNSVVGEGTEFLIELPI